MSAVTAFAILWFGFGVGFFVASVITANKRADALQDRAIATLQNAKLRGVLRELCDLKTMKSLQGKTAEYQKRKPRAWIRAYEVLLESEDK